LILKIFNYNLSGLITRNKIFMKRKEILMINWMVIILIILNTTFVFESCKKSPDQIPDPVTGSTIDTIEFSWTRTANMPTARAWMSTAASVLNDQIYVIGGLSDGTLFNKVEVFDPSSNTWTYKQFISVNRWGFSSDTIGGKIYIMGGCSEIAGGEALSSIEVYDPDADTWTDGGSMPEGRNAFGSCVVDGLIYVIGGETAEPPGTVLSSVAVYDPSADKWDTRAPMPSPRVFMGVSAVNGKIYAIGGTEASIGDRAIFEYDIASDTWTEKKAKLLIGRWGISTCVINNLIVIVGGFTGVADAGKSAVEVYSPEKDSIYYATPLKYKRGGLSACEYGGTIYVIGGTNVMNWATGCNYNESGVIDLK
jgi:N-acetylneuraminic acid mutarotase